LQLAILETFRACGLTTHAVVGHSSGEIAAAVAAGLLTPEQAIQIAYYRGKATSERKADTALGMMAVGLGIGSDGIDPYLEGTSIAVACCNSPKSITLSGIRSELEAAKKKLDEDGKFARILHVDAAYHSKHMAPAGAWYQDMLDKWVPWLAPGRQTSHMFSSTTGKAVSSGLTAKYWVKNMSSPVLFSQAMQKLIRQEDGANMLIEIGPSNALSGPISQIKKSLGSSIEYCSAWKRGSEAYHNLLSLAGKLFVAGSPINLQPLNQDIDFREPKFLCDLPNYAWNHSTKYWNETESSKDWRFRKFLHHDLIGSKILGVPWSHPTWSKVLRVNDLTWLRDHMVSKQSYY
jgi:acyl transferase domain-containing protein